MASAAGIIPSYPTDTSHFAVRVQRPLVAYNRLVAILLKAQDRFNDDSLSEKLADWSFELLHLVDTARGRFKLIEPAVQALVNKVSLEILINPHDGSPLEEPVIEKGMVYERWMHEHFRKTIEGRLTADRGPRPATVSPHIFAKEIIDFLDDLRRESGEMGYLDWARQQKIEEGVSPEDYQELAVKDPETHLLLCQKLLEDAAVEESYMQYFKAKDAELTLEGLEHEKALKLGVLAATEQESLLSSALHSTHESQEADSAAAEALHHRAERLAKKTDTEVRSFGKALEAHRDERSTMLEASELKMESDRRAHLDTVERLQAESKQRRQAEAATIHEFTPQIARIRSDRNKLVYDKYSRRADLAYLTRQSELLKSERDRLEARNRELTQWNDDNDGGSGSCSVM